MTRRPHRTVQVLAATGLLALTLTSLAAGGSGDALREGQRNPMTGDATGETQIISDTEEYSTRQSNKSDNGGGAIYGCRSGAGGTPTGNEPCLRSNNLSSGMAFELNATNGALGGTINVGEGGDGTVPFTTNATGVATGLNADRVDGMDAEALAGAPGPPGQQGDTGDTGDKGDSGAPATKLFAVVDGDHDGVVRGSGVTAFDEGAPDATVDVIFDRDLTDCAYIAGVSAPDQDFVPGGGGTKIEQLVNGNTLRVTTFDTDTATAAEHPFHVVVFC